jgi:hypothetical protein
MKPNIRYLTPLMAALVIGGAVGAAPAMASTPVARARRRLLRLRHRPATAPTHRWPG